MPLKTIRSFVKRSGRLTASQQHALTYFWQDYGVGVTADTVLNLPHLFGNDNLVILDIGFGDGDALIEMAEQNPQQNYLGIDVYLAGIGRLLANIKKRELSNIRVINGDAKEILQHNIDDNALAGVQLFFPDPWHKKRHHKRRLVQHDFLSLLAKKMASGGFFHIATDWQDYAQHSMACLSAHSNFKNAEGAYNYMKRPNARPITKFERRGVRLGHSVRDLMFVVNKGG